MLGVFFILAALHAATAQQVYDYAIAGGGTVGLALAARLSEDPSKSIIIIEAGESWVLML
jgi:choline dehydrogenase